MINPPELRTPGVIARELGAPLRRVLYVIGKLGVQPIGRAGTLRLFDREAVETVADELKAIAARRWGKEGGRGN